jgi:hypothetical protein
VPVFPRTIHPSPHTKNYTEIQTSIIHALYTSPKFPNYSAFLYTSKTLYHAAYPIFLTNYPLKCMPVKPGHLNAAQGLGRGDILKIVYPHDDERFRMHLFEEEWLEGLRSGMEGLFEVDDDEAASDDEKDDDGNEEEEWEEDETDFDEIEGFDINDMDATLFERGEQFARYWIRKNPFAKQFRGIGREKVEKMEKLEVNWGGWEANRIGEVQMPGPYAVGVMSVVCSLFLPNLKWVALRQTVFNEAEEEFYARQRFQGHDQEGESEEERWPERLRIEVMGPDDDVDGEVDSEQGYIVKAVRILVEACRELKVLELRDWKSRGNSRWWREMFEKEGLIVRVG